MRTTAGGYLVAALLLIVGAFDLLYADLSPLPPISDRPVPLAWGAIGTTSLVAAIGVLRGAPWGRPLGIAIVAFGLVYPVWAEIHWMRGTDPVVWIAQSQRLSLVVSVTVSSLALWWLVRRRPAR